MAVKISSSFQSRITHQVSLPSGLYDYRRLQIGVNIRCFLHGRLNTDRRFQNTQFIVFASTSDLISEGDDDDDHDVASKRFETVEFSRGRPGIISFYNQPYKKESDSVVYAITTTNQSNLFWFVGPAVLVASFVFPSLYTRKILSMVFEDPLLTDLLILLFTEALFYFGVVMFLFIVDYLHGPNGPVNSRNSPIPSPHLAYRVTHVAALVFSLVMISVVTMGLFGPWPGPLPSGTPHNFATNISLGMLLNVLQYLGLIYIRSLSNYLMRILPSMTPIINFMMPHTTKDKSWQAHVRSIIILILSGLV